MSFQHEAVAAWMNPGGPDPDLLRAMDTRRFAYCLAADEVASDFVAADPISGIIPLNLIQNSTIYAYDENDHTTAPSATCLITYDNKRYKSGTINPPDSVLTYSTTAQPADVDVSDGDTFLLPIGATGADWAGKAGKIAIRVGAKWHFAVSPIGRRLYVEDEDRFYYRNASGTWTGGNGSLAFAANSIPITAIIGAKASFVLKVENQTTNAPPASPVAPVAFIIGYSPTGAWAGLAGQLAACLVNGSYTIIVPARGDEVFDKNLGINVKFDGTAWVSAGGAIVGHASVFTGNGSTTAPSGTSLYLYSFVTAPTTAHRSLADNATLTYAAKRTGAKLIFRYSAASLSTGVGVGSGSDRNMGIGLFRDNVTAAIAWVPLATIKLDAVIDRPIGGEFEYTAPDTANHVYKIRVLSGSDTGGSAYDASSLTRRLFTLDEVG